MKIEITQESHDDCLSSEAFNELFERLIIESGNDPDAEIKFLEGFNAYILDYFGYENSDEFEADYQNIVGHTSATTGIQVYNTLLEAISLTDEERECYFLIDRIRELIASDDEVTSSNRILFYTAMLFIAVDALTSVDELREMLLDKLKETTLEIIEEASDIAATL